MSKEIRGNENIQEEKEVWPEENLPKKVAPEKALGKAPELIGEEVIERHNSYWKVKKYYRGHDPRVPGGVYINNGFTGEETVVEKDVIVPTNTIKAIQKPGSK